MVDNGLPLYTKVDSFCCRSLARSLRAAADHAERRADEIDRLLSSTGSVDTTVKEKKRVKSKDKSKEKSVVKSKEGREETVTDEPVLVLEPVECKSIVLEPVECKSISRISSKEEEILTPQSVFSDDSFEVGAARYFFDLAKRDHPHLVRYQFEEVRNVWADHILKLQVKYKHSQDDVRAVLRYVREIDEFWSKNILSVAKLLKLDKDHVRYFDRMLDLAHKVEPKKDAVPRSGMTIAKGEAAKLIERLGLRK
jgi:hypothetical protein